MHLVKPKVIRSVTRKGSQTVKPKVIQTESHSGSVFPLELVTLPVSESLLPSGLVLPPVLESVFLSGSVLVPASVPVSDLLPESELVPALILRMQPAVDFHFPVS